MNLYIHVPFCAQRCVYCDFFTQTKLGLREVYMRALLTEIQERRAELPEGERINHIYLGGGTPSLLSLEELEQIFSQIAKYYPLTSGAEITLEANPDDITAEYAYGLSQLPINRVSMGVQSFQEDDLRFLNRRHSVRQVYDAVDLLRHQGLYEMSLDLIYGLPNQTLDQWEDNLKQIVTLEVPHISAYHLIYEEGTPLTRALQRGKIQEVDEEVSLKMLQTLVSQLAQQGYEHYEISNFALPGHYAQLNTGYWLGEHYLGMGPAAHGFDGRVRSHNVASIEDYADGWKRKERYAEFEIITPSEAQNEYIMTRLRTMWGIDLSEMRARFGDNQVDHLIRKAQSYIYRGELIMAHDNLRLTDAGIFISDAIILALFE